MRWLASIGADTWIDTASSGEAAPGPSVPLIASATRLLVVKSASRRLNISAGEVLNGVSTIRSTVAPSGMRPDEGPFTTTCDPSPPSTPNPPTARTPYAIPYGSPSAPPDPQNGAQ